MEIKADINLDRAARIPVVMEIKNTSDKSITVNLNDVFSGNDLPDKLSLESLKPYYVFIPEYEGLQLSPKHLSPVSKDPFSITLHNTLNSPTPLTFFDGNIGVSVGGVGGSFLKARERRQKRNNNERLTRSRADKNPPPRLDSVFAPFPGSLDAWETEQALADDKRTQGAAFTFDNETVRVDKPPSIGFRIQNRSNHILTANILGGNSPDISVTRIESGLDRNFDDFFNQWGEEFAGIDMVFDNSLQIEEVVTLHKRLNGFPSSREIVPSQHITSGQTELRSVRIITPLTISMETTISTPIHGNSVLLFFLRPYPNTST